MNQTPPRPWSERMRNAAAVRSAYLELEMKLSDQMDAAPFRSREEKDLFNQLTAAQLQTNAAEAQMWIIHQEEQDTK